MDIDSKYLEGIKWDEQENTCVESNTLSNPWGSWSTCREHSHFEKVEAKDGN